MDPFTAAAAVISAVCAIAGAINSLQQLHERYKKRKTDKILGLDPDATEPGMPRGALELSLLMNSLLSKFGRKFGQSLDVRVQREILGLRPRLKAVISNLGKLKSEIESGRASEDIEKRRKELQDQTYCLKNEVEGALTQFTKRIGSATEPNEGRALLPERQLQFCHGAILCQSGKADTSKLSVPGTKDSPQRWGFVCSYCFLEVADYSAIRFSHHGKPVVHSDMLAASHVMACASFNDRRAYYKCLACCENHQDVDFSSAQAFEKHMQSHPGYSFIKNEAEAVRETEKDITDYVLEPSSQILSFVETGLDVGDVYEEPPFRSAEGSDADVSPASSPELSVRDLAENTTGSSPHRQQNVSSRNTPTAFATPPPEPAQVLAPAPTRVFPSAATIGNRPFPSELPAIPFATLSGPAEMSADGFGAPEPYFSSYPTTVIQEPPQQARRHEEDRSELPGAHGQASSNPGYPSPQGQHITNVPYYPHGISTAAPPSIRPGGGERAASHGSTAPQAAPRPTTQQRMPAQQQQQHRQQHQQQHQHQQQLSPRPGPADDPPQSSGSSQRGTKPSLRDKWGLR